MRPVPLPALLGSLALAALWLAGTPPARSQAGAYTVTALTANSAPSAVNSADPNNPRVVGRYYVLVRSAPGWRREYRIFLWTPASGTLTAVSGDAAVGAAIYANHINAADEVVGYVGSPNVGYYWHPSRGQNNPLLLPALGGLGSRANDINDAGLIVGHSDPVAAGGHAVYWQPGAPGVYGAPVQLPPMTNPDGTPNGQAEDATWTNAGGDIVGRCADANWVRHAVVWQNVGTPAAPLYGAPVDLGDGFTYSSGRWINTPGQAAIAGEVGAERSFLWTPGGPLVDLGDLGSGMTRGQGLNDLGQVCGASQPTDGQPRAFLWLPQADPAHGLVAGINNLGTLGGTRSSAGGRSATTFPGPRGTLNNATQVVGSSLLAGDSVTHAFLWDPANGMRDLNHASLTPNKAPFNYLEDASIVTDNDFIAGAGWVGKGGNAAIHAYLLRPN